MKSPLRTLFALIAALPIFLPSNGDSGTFSAFGPENFTRGTGAPVTVTNSFTVLNPNTSYTLQIDNGGLVDGEFELVSSSIIGLNGVQIVGPSEFSQNVTVIQKPVTLSTTNELSVELRGKPGGGITIHVIGVDNDTPTITASRDPPPNTAGWNNTDVTVSFTCSDATSGIATCPNPITITTEGANQVISGTAVDLAGNSASTSVTLNIDTTAPVLSSVLDPSSNINGWNNTDVTVSFTATDSLSGIASLTAPILLVTEGANQVVNGSATDVAGNSATTSVTVSIDRTVPIASITDPANGATLNTSPVSVAGTITEALSGIGDVTCNGAPAFLSDSTFTCDVSLVDGENSIIVEVTDIAGNVGSSSITVTLASGPVVSITLPDNLSLFNSSPITVSGSVDDTAVSVEVNGVSATVGAGTFTAEVSLEEGNNTITAVARDGLGNVGTSSIQVTLDTSPPRVVIDSPPDGFVTTSPSITVTGMINDIVVGTVNGGQAQVTVNGIAAQVANRSFLVEAVPLSPGLNTITAIGEDRAGNSATTSISVTLEEITGEPQINLISGNNQTGPVGSQLPGPLVVALTDGAGNPVPGKTVIYKVMENNGALSGSSTGRSLAVTTDAQGQAQALWTLGSRAGAGNNMVEATALRFAGMAIFTATALASTPAKINVDAGNNQTGVGGKPLPRPFVAVVTDAGHNRLANVPVTFTATEGGGGFNGQPTFTVNTDSDGRALAVLTLALQEGIDNNVVEATFPGNPGFPATFVASGKVAGDPAQTRISGVVLDNTDQPVPGVTMRIEGTALATQTDAQGLFVIQPAPVGHVELIADGSTAQRPGIWPGLQFDLVTIAGQDNTIGMPIYLLPIDVPNGLFVDETTGGTLTLPQVPGFSLTIKPGSATFPDGSKSGLVSVTVVHADKIPMTPNFGQQPRFIITIQPAGVLFDPPAPITIPNVDGLAPGEVTELYSFDHDLGQFVSIGTGTVSEDGTVIRSDTGVGIIKGGWHCGGNPAQTGSACDCLVCKKCENNTCVVDTALDPTCCQRASEQEQFKNQLSNSDPRKLFGNALSCVAGDICRSLGPQGRQFDDPTWMGCINKELFDKWKAHNSACWNAAEASCEVFKLLFPGNIPAQQLDCFGAMVFCHDVLDMSDSLGVCGCGTDVDWGKVGDIIGGCSSKFFGTVVEALSKARGILPACR